MSEFVDQVIAKFETAPRASAFDYIFDTIEDLLLGGKADAVATILSDVAANVGRFHMSALCCIMTVTLPWRESLGDSRIVLGLAILERAMRERGEEYTRAVFGGLIDGISM